MTTIRFLLVGGAVLISSTVYAQTSASSAGAGASSTVSSFSADAKGRKKSTHAQNSRFSSAVLRAIYRNRTVGAVEIFVSGNAATGKVLLTGYINDPVQEQAAISAARQVAGVTQVTSRLSLQEHGNY